MRVIIEPGELLRDGAIPKSRFVEVLEAWSSDPRIGGVVSFYGLVRADETEAGRVRASEFSAYREMAEPALRELVERLAGEIVERYPEEGEGQLRVHLEHAVGEVAAGEAPILIVVGAGHRAGAFDLARSVLEELKAKIPIYGKELLKAEGYRWKQNR